VVEVRLWPRAAVGGERIVLSDVAELRGGSAPRREALAGVVLKAAPAGGGVCRVSVDDVTKGLELAGENLAEVLLGGATACDVRRAFVGRGEGAVSAAADRNGQRTLAERLREYLVGRAGVPGAPGVEVRFSRASRAALELSEPEYAFRILTRGGEGLGLVSVEVELVRDGQVLQRVPVVAQVSAEVAVVVARRSINRGAEIEAADVGLERRRFDRLDQIGLTDLSAAVGQQAVRFIGLGEALGPRDLRPLPLVKRGDVVTVRLRQGGVVVEAAGKALGPGCYGETVEVRGPGSKDGFSAKVTGARTVEVCP
jgi:flagella basal body P-ring formation protein FlgA